ncbi:hypothetical protein CLAIMM_10216 isoform 1, partial [Cladophialophora immunda]
MYCCGVFAQNSSIDLYTTRMRMRERLAGAGLRRKTVPSAGIALSDQQLVTDLAMPVAGFGCWSEITIYTRSMSSPGWHSRNAAVIQLVGRGPTTKPLRHLHFLELLDALGLAREYWFSHTQGLPHHIPS